MRPNPRSSLDRTAEASSFAAWYSDGSDVPAKRATAIPLTRASSGTAHKARGTRREITDDGIAAFMAGEIR